MKVGGWGHTYGAKRGKTFVLPLHFFGSSSTISRFVERFRDGQYSLASFLFNVLLLTGARAPVTYGVGAIDYSKQQRLDGSSSHTVLDFFCGNENYKTKTPLKIRTQTNVTSIYKKQYNKAESQMS